MGSHRFTGKTLADVCGRPLLGRVIDRLRPCTEIDDIVVATTTRPEDRTVVDFAIAEDVLAITGDADDVLDRYLRAAQSAAAEIIVRICADDPLKDPAIVDLVVHALRDDPELDYASNTIRPTFPEGQDVEAVRMSALARAWDEARRPSEREHVTPYIINHPDRFKLKNVENDEDLSALRWTLDYPADLEFTREIYARMPSDGLFSMRDTLDLLARHPEFAALNSGIRRNEGYLDSVDRETRGTSQ